MAKKDLAEVRPLDQYGTVTLEGWEPGENLSLGAAIACVRDALERHSSHQFVVADTLEALRQFEGAEAYDLQTGAPAMLPEDDKTAWVPALTDGEVDSPVVPPKSVPKGAAILVPFDYSQAVTPKAFSSSRLARWTFTGRRFPPGHRTNHYRQFGPYPVLYSHMEVVSPADITTKQAEALLKRRAKEGLSVREMAKEIKKIRGKHRQEEELPSGEGEAQPSAYMEFMREARPVLARVVVEEAQIPTGDAEAAAAVALRWMWFECDAGRLEGALADRGA